MLIVDTLPPPQPIQIIHQCNWQQPGANPWKGNDINALQLMGLTTQDVSEFTHKRNSANYSHTVYFSSEGVEQEAFPYRVYKPTFMMTFGKDTLCLATTTTKLAGKYPAKVYYLSSGKYIAVPDVCNNLSLLTLDHFRFEPKEQHPDWFFPKEEQSRHTTVPEPSPFPLVLLGSLFIFISTYLRKLKVKVFRP